MTLSWWRARIYSAAARGVTFFVSQVPEGESGDRGGHGRGRGLVTFFLERRVARQYASPRSVRSSP